MATSDNMCRTANGWDINGFGQLKTAEVISALLRLLCQHLLWKQKKNPEFMQKKMARKF